MRTRRLLLILAPLLAMGWVVRGCVHDDRLVERFQRIRPGMEAGAVEAILGAPSWRERCGSRFPYYKEPGCAEEMVYAVSFAPLKPSYYVVELDRRGRVIVAVPIHSP